MRICCLGSATSAGVYLCSYAILSCFSPSIQQFSFLLFDRPVHGEIVGIQVFDISDVCSGILLVVLEEAVGIRHCCGEIIVTLQEFIPQVI